MRESTTEKDVAAELQLSVPAEKLSEVFDALARLGEERRRQVSTEDVAEEVGDVETDLTTTSPCANRLRTLVRQAKEVKDVLV